MKNKKNIIILFFILLIAIFFLSYFKIQNNIDKIKVEEKKIEQAQKKREKEIEKDLKKYKEENQKAIDFLSERTDSSIKKSIEEFKRMYEENDILRIKAKALQKLASIYWRTAGNQKVAEEIFSGKYQKFLDPTGMILLSNRNLLKESYQIYPISRTAIEISFNLMINKEYKEGMRWLAKYDKLKSKNIENNPAFTIYREFLTYLVLAINLKEEKEYAKKVETLYPLILNRMLKESRNYEALNKNNNSVNEFKQSIPFLKTFFASYLVNRRPFEKEKINKLIEEIIEQVKKDKDQKRNQYVYFLNMQSKKEEPGYIYENFIKKLVEENSKFKDFFLSYNIENIL